MRIDAIVLKDGQSTPVNHTFAPMQVQSFKNDGTVIPASWKEAGITFAADKTVTLSNSLNGNKVSVTRGKVQLPKVISAPESCCTAGSIIEESSFSFEFKIPRSFTSAERADLYAYTVAYLNLAIVKDAVLNNERVY